MATVHLHLQNVPPEAGAKDIRHLFSQFDIPHGGVQIVGGPYGEAFVTFSNYEDLLKATSYDKSYLMGRQLRINLVNRQEVERIIDNMKRELAVRIRPMEMLRSQQTSQSREPLESWGRVGQQGYTPSMEFPSDSNNHQWQKHQFDPVQTDLAGYSRSDMYAGGEPKRMRMTRQEPDEGMYYNSTDSRSADGVSTNMQIELEVELRRAQEIKDQLERNKEKIEKLKQGIIGQEIVTAPATSSVAGEHQRSQIMHSGGEWSQQSSQPQAEQPRYQYHREDMAGQSEPYQDYYTTPREESRYQRERQQSYQNSAWQPPYGSQGSWYDQGSSDYSGQTPYYADQGYSGENEGYNHSSTLHPAPRPYRNQSYGGDFGRYNHLDPEYDGPRSDYRAQQPQSSYSEYQERRMSEKQRKQERQDRKWGENPFGHHGITWKPKPSGSLQKEYVKMSQSHPASQPVQRSSVRGKRPKVDSSPYSGGIKQALYYTAVRNLPGNATASSVWKRFDGSAGRSIGVLLLEKRGLAPVREAFVAYEDYYDRNSEISKHEGATDWMDSSVYKKFANATPEYKMYKTTPTGETVEISADDKAIFGQEFLLNSSLKAVSKMTEQERESNQLIVNKISQSLFDLRTTEGSQQLDIPDAGEEKPGFDVSRPCYLRLDCLPPGITDLEVWEWFGADKGPCLQVNLTGNNAQETKVAYVAFKDATSRKAEAYKYSQSKALTEEDAIHEMAGADVTVIESTDRVMAEKIVQQIENEVEASRCVLKIGSVDRSFSATRLWLTWFGGETGPTSGVTILDKGGATRTAFAVFRNPKRCRAEQKKHVHSEVISHDKMLLTFAFYPQPRNIRRSHVKGDRMMSKKEQEILRPRIVQKMREIDAKGIKNINSTEHTLVTSKEKQKKDFKTENASSNDKSEKKSCILEANLQSTTQKLEENGNGKNTEKIQSKLGIEKEGNIPDDTPKNIAPTDTPLKRKDSKDTREEEAAVLCEEKGLDSNFDQTSEGPDPSTSSNPEENTTGTSIAGLKLKGSTEEKFFLQMPGISKRITACNIWKWFDGPEGSVSCVIMVPVFGGSSSQAYLEFGDEAARDAALPYYPGSKVMTEKEVLCILAAQARRLSAEIYVASDEGVDRALTREELALIIEKASSGEIPKVNADKSKNESTEKDKDENADKDKDEKEEKFFLRIPNLGKRVTACDVWSWFGGARGPLPGVTLIQEAAGRCKHAFVGFTDPTTRNAVKLQYNSSTELDEDAMLCTLAEACKSNAGIFQSSTSGKDRLLTIVERELIKKQAFSERAKGGRPSQHRVPSHSWEQPEIVSDMVQPEYRSASSSGSGLSRQASAEYVPINEQSRDRSQAQSRTPRLLQKSEYEYIHLTELRPEATAFMLSLQYKPCCGVTLIKNPLGSSTAAYIAFEPKTNPIANVWQKTRDRELADLPLHYEIYEDTGRLGDRLITLKERQEFREYVKRMLVAGSVKS